MPKTPKRLTLEEALQDVEAIKTIARGLPRGSGAIYILLKSWYSTGFKWHDQRASRSLRDALVEQAGKRVHGRTKKAIFRLLIELTYDCKVQLKSRYANALEYAQLEGVSVEEVVKFLKNNGIEESSQSYIAYRKR